MGVDVLALLKKHLAQTEELIAQLEASGQPAELELRVLRQHRAEQAERVCLAAERAGRF